MRVAGRIGSRVRKGAPLVVACAALLGGCSGERSFDAEGVVEELNSSGAGLTLGAALPSEVEGVEVTVLGFEQGEGSGAVVVVDGSDRAREEFQRCEQAVSFVCFRAANAVLRFTDLGPVEQQRISTAVASLETG